MVTERDIADAARELREFAKMGLLMKDVAAQARVLNKCTILRDLPQTRRAETERPTPQFEYLVQAIVDAIDQIEIRGHHADAAVLRVLFGLADPVRRGDWARRQDEAARVCGVGRDHFRRNLQEPLLVAVAERLIFDTRSGLTTESAIQNGHLSAAASQDGFVTWMTDYVVQHRPQTALLLELSTATVGTMLDALCAANTETKLLVANPYTSKSMWQQERVWMTLVNRFQHDFAAFDKLEVRMYDVPPGLRGRLIGDWFSLGWYTYRDDTRHPAEDPNATVIWGHDNAMVHGSAGSESGAILAGWFRMEFERLWRHRLTRRGTEVRRMLGLSD